MGLRAPQGEKRKRDRACVYVCVRARCRLSTQTSVVVCQQQGPKLQVSPGKACHTGISYFTEEWTLCKLLRSSLRDDIMDTINDRRASRRTGGRTCMRARTGMCVRMCVYIHTVVSRCSGVYIRAVYYREKILPEEIDIAPDDNVRARTHNVTPMHVCTHLLLLRHLVLSSPMSHSNTETHVARTIQEIFYALLLSRASECALSST